MSVTLETVASEFKEARQEFIDALQKRDDEIKRLGGTTSDTAELVKGLEAKFVDAEKNVSEVKATAEQIQEKFGGLSKEEIEGLIKFKQQMELNEGRPRYGNGAGSGKSLGDVFVESAQFKRMKDDDRLTSDPVRLASLWDPEQKQLTSDPESAGTLIQPFRVGDLRTLAQRRLRIRDLLPARPITTNQVEYVEESGFTNNAGPVAEAPEDPKPESDLTYELKTADVKTLAHWIRASRQVIDDAPQLRTRIDTQLVYGLEYVVENQILYGSGLGENLQGILTHPDIQSYAIGDSEVASDTKIDAIRRAMTRVELAFYEATGVVMHPLDWEDIELMKDNEDRYIWIVVTEGGIQRLFRLPVVVTPAINEGQALLGAFDLGAMLWDRQQAMIRMSEHHADFFTKNMVAVLAELRLALEISRPESFVDITLEAAG